MYVHVVYLCLIEVPRVTCRDWWTMYKTKHQLWYAVKIFLICWKDSWEKQLSSWLVYLFTYFIWWHIIWEQENFGSSQELNLVITNIVKIFHKPFSWLLLWWLWLANAVVLLQIFLLQRTTFNEVFDLYMYM